MKRTHWILIALALVMTLCLPAQAAGNGETAYRALLVGVDGYQTNALSGCVTDANRMAATLQAANEAGAFYQAPVIRSNLQTDEITALFKEVATWNVDEDDVTFFYFAGHGYMSDKGTPAIVGKDSKMLPISDLLVQLDTVPGVKVILFDCRYADSLLKDEPSAAQALAAYDSAVLDIFKSSPTSANYYVLTASTLASSEALALGENEEPRGLITYLVTQGTGYDYVEQRATDDLPADTNGNGAVSLSEARDYIGEGVAALAKGAEIVYDAQIFPANSAYPLLARRATSEVLEVTLSSAELTVPVGKSRQLEAATQPVNASKRSIYWSSSDLSIAKVDEDGNVYGVQTGDAAIAATTANGLTVTTTAHVRDIQFVESLELNASRLAIAPGSSVPLQLTMTPADADESISWRSDNLAVATVDDQGTVNAVGLGEALVAATSENGIEVVCSIRVIEQSKVVNAIKVSKPDLRIYAGESRQISVQIKPEKADDLGITYTSSDPLIATVSDSGVVSGVAVGECTISAVASSGLSAPVKVTVQGASIELSKTSLSLKRGKSAAIKTRIKPSTLQAALVWESSNPAVATVSNGKITAIEAGDAVITATLPSGEVAECKVLVDGVAVKQLKVSPARVKMAIGEQKPLIAQTRPQNATVQTLAWKSSDEQVVQVDDTGNLTAISSGRATVTATAHSGVKARCQVQVSSVAVNTLSLDQSELTLVAGMSGQNKATLTADTLPVSAGNGSVNWVSSNPKIASVDQSGNVLAKSEGKAVIKAVSKSDKRVSATCQVTVTANRTVGKQPITGSESKLYTSAKRVYYKGGYLVVDLYFSNRSSSAVTVPEEGTLMMRQADGNIVTITDVKAGNNKLKAGKTGAISYKTKVQEGDALYGLDLRDVQVELVKAGETPSFGVAPSQTPTPQGEAPIDDADLPEAADLPESADPLGDDADDSLE